MNDENTELNQLIKTLELAPCGVALFLTDSEKMIFANEAYCRMLGYSKEEYIQQHDTQRQSWIVPEDRSAKSESKVEFHQKGEALNYEYRVIGKDDAIIWLKMSATTIQADGMEYAFASFSDITKEKEATIKAQLEQRRFELVAGELNIAVIEWDADGENFYSSSAYQNYAMSQVSHKLILNNQGPADMIYPDDGKQMQQFFEETRSGKERVDTVLRMKMMDGGFHWCHLIGFFYRDHSGKITHTIGVIEDVNAEHERSFELNNLLNELPGGVAIFKVSKTLVCQYFSDGFAAMTGRTREQVNEMLQNAEKLKQGIPLDNYYDFLGKLKENKELGKTLSFVYHAISADGEISWLHVAATMIRVEQGAPVYYCIYTKPTDEAILYRNIVEDSAIGVFVGDQRTGLNLYSNRALSEICGFEPEQILGKTKDEMLSQYEKKELLTREQIQKLSYEAYTDFHALRRGNRYLAVKAKALKWNGTDAYILYIADETSEYEHQIQLQKNVEELERNRLKEQTLLESIPGGLAVYRMKKDGRAIVEYASEGFARMCGYTIEECLAFPDINENVVKEDIPRAADEIYRAIQTREPIHVLYRIRKKNGEIVLNRLDANMIADAPMEDDDLAVLYAVQTVVTEETKKTLQEQKHYRQVLNMLGIAYWEWSEENGYYASSNYAKYELSRASFDAVRDSSVYDGIVHPEDMHLLKEFLAMGAAKQRRCSMIMRMHMIDGTYQWTEVQGFREYNESGKPIRISCTLRDINEEWVKQKEALQEALDAAKAANEAKTVFISRISHDMRTPLNGILGITSFLKESETDEERRKDISQLELSGQYLLGLINDTLDISRIENGKIELHPVVCDGKRAFEDMMQLARPNIEAKHIDFTIYGQNVPYTMLYIDLSRAEQVIMNIVGNAVKFTPEYGRITLTLRNLAEDEESVTVEISVQDSGIGMSQEFLPHLFEAFSQADTAKTNVKAGTGLGMAITKYLVDIMGGTIHVESKLGKGSCFTIVLPMQKASDQQVSEWREAQMGQEDDRIFIGKRVLLCEDHPLNQQIAVRILQQKEIEVDTAVDGAIGLLMYEQSEPGYYDVILMDVNMPVMDGISATRRIRQADRTDAQTIPIIAMTGNSFDDDIQRCLDAGMTEHLSKPIDPKKMFATMKDALVNPKTYHRKKVLVVDDIEMNRAVICAAINEDYNIVEAESGAQALAVLHQEGDIDAVITNMMMAEMDGVELIRQIRSKPQYDRIAIIANTQYGEVNQEKDLRAIGANAFLYKPNVPEVVERQLRSALRNIR